MDTSRKMEEFLAKAKSENPLGQREIKQGVFPFLTISRQTGAGGHSLAEAVLSAMGQVGQLPLFQGWRIFDQEIVQLLNRDPDIRLSLKYLFAQESRAEMEGVVKDILVGQAPQTQVLTEMFHIMRTLATVGKVIVVGRGGACVTQGLPGGIHIRLIADRTVRIHRMVSLLKVSQAKATQTVDEQDKARSELVRRYFKKDIDDPRLYDMVLNTETCSPTQMAKTILRLIEAKVTQRQAHLAKP